MNQKLQEAINATRAGQKQEAQLLLTELLKEEPQEVQAWYLLGLLVESPQKQAAFLGKALALDPAHERARERLHQLQAETAAAAAEPAMPWDTADEDEAGADEAFDILVQERGSQPPAWLADPREVTASRLPQPDALPPDEEEAVPGELPDWLRESVDDNWTAASDVKEAAQAAAAVAAPKPAAAVTLSPRRRTGTAAAPAIQQARLLNGLLAGLIFIAIVVFLLLIYYAFFA